MIALVVTIIVLLILAAVSIATLTGENGILTQTQNAKEETRGASVQEARDLWKINQEADNQTESETAQTLEELLNDLEKQNLITPEERITIKETGQVIIGSRTIVFKAIEIITGEILKTDSTATEAANKSPYVKYNGLNCRVLYNDETHGLQIITADSVETVRLGSRDSMVTSSDFTYDGTATVDDSFLRAAASYNNVVDNLNNKAKSYMDTKGIAKDARSLGSIPTLTSESMFQGDTSGMWSGTYTYLTTYSWNNKFKTGDTNYSEDVSQLKSLGLNVSSGYTWLASRYMYSDYKGTNFQVHNMYASDAVLGLADCVRADWLGDMWSDGTSDPYYESKGFRPVFLLPSEVVISRGDGSSENPYVIE